MQLLHSPWLTLLDTKPVIQASQPVPPLTEAIRALQVVPEFLRPTRGTTGHKLRLAQPRPRCSTRVLTPTASFFPRTVDPCSTISSTQEIRGTGCRTGTGGLLISVATNSVSSLEIGR